MRRDRAILSETFVQLVCEEPVVLVDVGARGDLEEPWRLMDSAALRVLGFEPDREECERLNQGNVTRRYLPEALWSASGEVDIHVAAYPGCSSVHPPNAKVLERYAEDHVRPRETSSIVGYPARTLDEILGDEQVSCDVVKIDTQGSEGDVISGAERVLRDDAFAVLVETWTVEVHRGQALTGDVMCALNHLGFSVFDVNIAAAWSRRAGQGRELVAKRQVTGLDLLMLKDPPPEGPAIRRVKWAAIADAYGFTDYALEILASDRSTEARAMHDAVLRGAAPSRRVKAGLGRLLDRRSAPGEDESFPSLHG